MEKNLIPKVGEVYKDRSGEPSYPNKRTIQIAQVVPAGVIANVLTDTAGLPYLRPRSTTMTLRTLRSGYDLVGGV